MVCVQSKVPCRIVDCASVALVAGLFTCLVKGVMSTQFLFIRAIELHASVPALMCVRLHECADLAIGKAC
jgi:hypothetical protein